MYGWCNLTQEFFNHSVLRSTDIITGRLPVGNLTRFLEHLLILIDYIIFLARDVIYTSMLRCKCPFVCLAVTEVH